MKGGGQQVGRGLRLTVRREQLMDLVREVSCGIQPHGNYPHLVLTGKTSGKSSAIQS